MLAPLAIKSNMTFKLHLYYIDFVDNIKGVVYERPL